MKRIEIKTTEEIHHICLMNGLKSAFLRFPFLADNIMATPPPVRRKPEKTRPLLGFRRNPVNVQYYNKDILVLYDENKAAASEATVFAKAVMEEYLAFRHPYMKISWEGCRLKEEATGHLLAEVIPESPETAGTL